MVWLVDPEDRTVTVFRKGQEPIFLEETDELTGLDVLPDFRCSVADFFVIPQ
jgi:Uma2 family endonuclease